MIEERQFKCRNWIGFFLPLFTVMSDPRLAFLQEGSAPILFVAWLALAFEWHSAFSDTMITKAHGYTPDAVYANRVGCSYGDSACNLLSWYIASLFGTSFCFFVELIFIIYIQHREQWCDFFVGLFCRIFRLRTILTAGSGPSSDSTACAASACASEETIDLETYGNTFSNGPNGTSPAGAQTPTTFDTLTFPWSRLPSRIPTTPSNANELNGSTSLCSRTPTSQFVLGQDDVADSAQDHCHQQAIGEDEVLEILSTNHTYPSREGEESSFDVFGPPRVNNPRPITRSFTSVASMLSPDMCGPRSRADTPYPHHVPYLPCEPTVTRIFMVHSIEYGKDPFMSTAAAVTAADQVDAQGAVDCVIHTISFPQSQFAITAAIKCAVQLESQSPSSPQPQSAVAAIEVAIEENAQSFSSSTQPQEVSEVEATVSDYNADAEDDVAEEVGSRYGRYDLDEYKKLLHERRMRAYFTIARPQMLELAKYVNDPLPECPQQ
ncbi:hypothetical protein BG015_011864 [Linnemannia schmuckeri]|uniref:Uncharacterized protein n=1 Tax=Linnemannia schmuckeri TaxID=64567 RepID=A0A9P5V877_9FUNG|nr:hypothetical protein BG015_011864 [Linnemannia schmuckeri]